MTADPYVSEIQSLRQQLNDAVHAAAEYDAIVDALNGIAVSDFMESVPNVRLAQETYLLAQAYRENEFRLRQLTEEPIRCSCANCKMKREENQHGK